MINLPPRANKTQHQLSAVKNNSKLNRTKAAEWAKHSSEAHHNLAPKKKSYSSPAEPTKAPKVARAVGQPKTVQSEPHKVEEEQTVKRDKRNLNERHNTETTPSQPGAAPAEETAKPKKSLKHGIPPARTSLNHPRGPTETPNRRISVEMSEVFFPTDPHFGKLAQRSGFGGMNVAALLVILMLGSLVWYVFFRRRSSWLKKGRRKSGRLEKMV